MSEVKSAVFMEALIAAVTEEAQQAARYLGAHNSENSDTDYGAGFQSACEILGTTSVIEDHVTRNIDRILAATTTHFTSSEGLREVLKPFADAAADYDYHDGQPAFDEYPDASSLPEINDLTVGDLRAARALHVAFDEG